MLTIFTVWLTFAQPGVLHGEMRVCVAASSLARAGYHGLRAAHQTIKRSHTIEVKMVLSDGCPWMPSDLED